MPRLPEIHDRAGQMEQFPCGCIIEPEWGHVRPCARHEPIPEAQLWETLKAEFPEDSMEVTDGEDQ